MEKLNEVILLFFIYSFIGWIWETTYCSLKAGKFVYRGFLIGPYCPIYGFGVLSVLYFVLPFQNNIYGLSILSALIVSILEYFTSFMLEKMFHATWWDYKNVPLNINGRVAVPVSLFWGLGCVIIVKWVQPWIMGKVIFIENRFGMWVGFVLLGIMSMDMMYTLFSMKAFQKAIRDIETAIENKKQEVLNKQKEVVLSIKEKQKAQSDYGKEWLEYFKNNVEEWIQLPKLNFNGRRFFRNYKKLNLKNVKYQNDVLELIKVLQTRNKKEKK